MENKLHVIFRKSLSPRSKNKSFFEIAMDDIPESSQKSREAAIVVFVENNGSTRVLKNRWGIPGIVISDKQYADYKRLLVKEADEEIKKLRDEINKSDSSTKKKSFLGRFFKGNIWPLNCA